MTKREREFAEMRYNLCMSERKVQEMTKALDEAIAALKWSRKTLIEKEEENRKLKFVIMELTGGNHDGVAS